jgi:hypothetical protein
LLVGFAAVALPISACGGDDDGPTSAPAADRTDEPTTAATAEGSGSLCERFDADDLEALLHLPLRTEEMREGTPPGDRSCVWPGSIGYSNVSIEVGKGLCTQRSIAVQQGKTEPRTVDGLSDAIFDRQTRAIYGTTPDGSCIEVYLGTEGTAEEYTAVAAYVASVLS